jgi:GST-like protein
LNGRDWIVGDSYSIADMSAWGWLERARFVLGQDDPLAPYPNVKRLHEAVSARPAAARARLVGKDHAFKREVDEVALRSLFPSNYSVDA